MDRLLLPFWCIAGLFRTFVLATDSNAMPMPPVPASPSDSPGLIDSPLIRRAGKGVLSLALMDARNHTLHLFTQFQSALEVADFVVPLLPTLNPPLWELGHVGWFQEYWIGRNLQRSQGAVCDPAGPRLPSLESAADRWWDSSHVPHDTRWSLDLPNVNACRAYLLNTLESTLELLERADATDDALYFYRLCLLHEDMHAEAMVMTAQTLGLALDRPLLQAFAPKPMTLREPLLIPACHWTLGSQAEGAGFVFDNEVGPHEVRVPEFEIDAQPVSWAQFVEFVADGGYDRQELWSEAGWRWLQTISLSEGRRGPRYVDQISVASGAVMQNRFGQPLRMLGNQPAMHMSWWEADAWCRWAGRRLPFEVEWEIAAQTAGRRGFHWGDVWEWTGNTFKPYPGFVPGPYADYSQPWFGSYKVLRGGSFATRARMKSPKYRNFYEPDRDDVFCGFRSCSL
jgi:ergothioneine biosynthesis protein EgtB